MPTYVYECSSCNNRFEVDQRITENPLETCRCGSTGTVKRVIQPVGIMFKGTGFHINDYAPSTGKDEKQPEAKTDATATPPCTGDPGTCACSQPADS